MTAAVLGGVFALIAYAGFAVLSVVLAVVDVRTHRLPDRLVLPAYPAAAVLLSAAALLAGEPGRLLATLGGAIVLFAFYLALGMLRPGAMGGGDVKLAGVTGAFLGFLGWETVFAGALAGFVLGGIFGLALLVLRRARRDTRIAFGPFLLAGAWWAVIVAALALR
jgi:leader peptidase (prepilin peptidase) / N-methyltransferase